jgi:hypothetical protein
LCWGECHLQTPSKLLHLFNYNKNTTTTTRKMERWKTQSCCVLLVIIGTQQQQMEKWNNTKFMCPSNCNRNTTIMFFSCNKNTTKKMEGFENYMKSIPFWKLKIKIDHAKKNLCCFPLCCVKVIIFIIRNFTLPKGYHSKSILVMF